MATHTPAFSVAPSSTSRHGMPSLLPRHTSVNSIATRVSRSRARPRPHTRTTVHASAGPPSNGNKSNSNGFSAEEDEALQRELSAKVNELFGGRQNVTIDVDTDSERAKFSVRRTGGGLIGRGASVAEAESDRERGAALSVITSVAVMSIVAGFIFTFLYYNGAVHGSSSADARRYDMPTYGTASYIDPYKLLDEERQAAENNQ